MDQEYHDFERKLDVACTLVNEHLTGNKAAKKALATLNELKGEFTRLKEQHWTMQMAFAVKMARSESPEIQS